MKFVEKAVRWCPFCKQHCPLAGFRKMPSGQYKCLKCLKKVKT